MGRTLFGNLAQLLVAQFLNFVPEVQDGVKCRLKGSFWIDHHSGQVPTLQGTAHGLVCLRKNISLSENYS